MDWDHLVRVGSSHLVLPAIYCRLKAKKLLGLLPQELETYLKELTDLNRERNEQLLVEAQQISQWFQEANIDHVFLKVPPCLPLDIMKILGNGWLEI